MKKLLALILALAMVFSLAVAASATEGTGTGGNTGNTQTTPPSGTIEDTKGSITLNNITLGTDNKPTATYAIYQILKLNSFDFGSGSYFYEYTNTWRAFFTEGAGKDYINLNDKGLLEWKGSDSAERVEEFAKLALEYAKANNIAPTKTTATPAGEADQYTVDTQEGNKIIFSDLQLGYYLVDSTVGALCGLSTTNPDGLINAKNGAPTLEKQVQEDLGGQWGKVNSADIGQIVNFRITIHVHDGAQNYVLHDIMDPSFTIQENTGSIMVRDGATGVETSYAPTTTVTNADNTETIITNYTIMSGNNSAQTDGHTFCIQFSESFCDSLDTNDRLIITYSAMLNRKAEIGNGTEADPVNENKAYLSYGEGHQTAVDSTSTRTYGFDLVKTDGQNKLLDGSEFKIYSEETGGSEVTIVPLKEVDDDQHEQLKTADGYYMYRKARPDETGVTAIVVNGKVRIIGLDNGVYWLEETKAPDGFNPITSRQKFTISDNNLDAIIANNIVSTNSGVQVVNHTGTMLPETGGLGTLLFTVLGGSTVLGTGVVLVTKKRMSKIKDED